MRCLGVSCSARFWPRLPTLAIPVVAWLAAFPAFAQDTGATTEEMELAKSALAEALKREQAAGRSQVSPQMGVDPSAAPSATVTPGAAARVVAPEVANP